MQRWSIDPDVSLARTPPAALYNDPRVFRALGERVFARSWQLVPEASPWPEGSGRPDGAGGLGLRGTWRGAGTEEALWLTDSGDGRRAFSDVCTHRGHPLELRGGARAELRCGYHGRRFGLDGACKGQPGMEGSAGFPCAEDGLRVWALDRIGPLTWAALEPERSLGETLPQAQRVLGALPLGELRRDPAGDRAFEVEASWVLYVENYLEGLHVPFVHPGLAQALDLGAYGTEVFERAVLQVGRVAAGEPALELPEGHPDRPAEGRAGAVGALYLWCFPNLMLNVYPWGLSVNQVEPLGPRRCRVRYLRFTVGDQAPGAGAGGDLDQVEQEDQDVVQAVQRRMASAGRIAGRYSPEFEAGVHRFHRLLTGSLESGTQGRHGA